ncbi:hypothetical protein J7T55_004316 [Diaporthe amygdali]|uniref:uncharacterized protein n=1 Tax=Phomopsis amygdali TaxID=1214568 RepID=UPI0022FE6EE2|nr:uncharacterized protein J7T55_004316 [Diaporthe amygdali]KAJ0109767.1 hypothetical protein J7T55_004316 [Diaporthe amygdali]
MKTSRYATSRQKACQHCITSKAKCDRRPERCGRCTLRGLNCTYPQERVRTPTAAPGSPQLSPHAATVNPGGSRVSSFGPPPKPQQHNPDVQAPATPATSVLASEGPCDGKSPGVNSAAGPAMSTPAWPSVSVHSNSPHPDSTTTTAHGDLELCCPINADDIASRWLNPYVPIPGQEVKEYPGHIKAFIPKILASYASVAVRGRGFPPFVHPAQLQPLLARPPLSTCLGLVRICEKLLPGSEGAAADVIQREMSILYEQHASMDDGLTLLSAFQAHLLYSMVLFFRLGHLAGQSLRRAMMDLQDIASLCSRRGLVCLAEQQRARPRWESWIIAEAKRRTLYTMYLFDSVLSTQEGLPTFRGNELQGLPAPTGKYLWEAQTQRDWETAYNTHLADWADSGLRLDELWPAPSWLDESSLVERRKRVDQWLDDVDGFGTMIYAVSSSLTALNQESR